MHFFLILEMEARKGSTTCEALGEGTAKNIDKLRVRFEKCIIEYRPTMNMSSYRKNNSPFFLLLGSN